MSLCYILEDFIIIRFIYDLFIYFAFYRMDGATLRKQNYEKGPHWKLSKVEGRPIVMINHVGGEWSESVMAKLE